MHFLGPDPTRFPPIEDTDADGIIAVGGDLRPERLEEAYRRGIFPWYSEGLPILWHCPDPRFVLEPKSLHVPRSLRKMMNRGVYEVKLDTAFEGVIDGCAKTKRPGQRGTWITRDMRKAYLKLHELGLAHSAETWFDGRLVGGLYGVSLGRVFYGESMFAHADDASKVAFVTLVEWMRGWGVQLVDCQQETAHLARFGATPWPRDRFTAALASLTSFPTRQGRWSLQEGAA
ncbi:MAG: leucyl/phenylalanyl-tRNA--protein transferase [Archangium gephyra]|uniref:Leucyl/phenylalanyl-tRNA--protein transferase n=1 Tax=Archangium gephyra TaxID=48 RepID=A0A2W5TF55_9BACT|nr:MAG: leucyl/phenylalanyl-tRNA--protein transferase [Archangium gephyra]